MSQIRTSPWEILTAVPGGGGGEGGSIEVQLHNPVFELFPVVGRTQCISTSNGNIFPV